MSAIVSLALRILVPVLIACALFWWGYNTGESRESDRRDAIALQEKLKADADFDAAAGSARLHARSAIEWQQKADRYYLNWQEKLNEKENVQLSSCEPQPDAGSAPACVLGPVWVGLYNDAWLPDAGLQSAGAGGTADPAFDAGTVTPREALINVRINAALCAADRKRQDELIGYLREQQTADAGKAD